MNEGESLILNQVDRYDDKCSEVASALSNAMGQYVNANAYISKQGSGGFSTHFDTHDVIVVQIHGRKLWDIFAPPPSLRRFPTKADKLLDLNILESLPIKQIELTEGQTLYLPRGYPHKASAQDCDSVHVTFGLTPITIKDVFQQIIDRAFDDHEDIRGSAFELPYSDNLIASNVEMISKTLNSLMSSERILNSLAELQVDRRDSHTDGEKFKSLFG